MKSITLAALALLVAACAAGPEYRSDYDRSVDFTNYETYGFMENMATDKGAYSSLLTAHFENAIRREMDALGYRYAEADPDLLINVFANVEDVEAVRTRRTPNVGLNYYDYRYGMYGTFPLYRNEVETVRYKQGTANIDVVDAEERRLIWEGVAEGRLSAAALQDPAAAVDVAVANMFDLYPLADSGGTD